MKYLCERCERLADAARFRLDGAELVLTCSRCGAETHAQSAEPGAEPVAVAAAPRPAAPAPPSVAPAPPVAPAPRVVPLHAVPPPTFGTDDPFAVPDDRCPKCVAPRPEGTLTCAQCGLVFVNFVPGDHSPTPELKATWAELATHWDDLAAHDRALALAAARGELASMGRLYRIRLARQPRDPIASRGRDEVLRLATSTSLLWPDRSLGPPGSGGGVPERVQRLLLVVAAVMMVGSLLFLGRFLFFHAG